MIYLFSRDHNSYIFDAITLVPGIARRQLNEFSSKPNERDSRRQLI